MLLPTRVPRAERLTRVPSTSPQSAEGARQGGPGTFAVDLGEGRALRVELGADAAAAAGAAVAARCRERLAGFSSGLVDDLALLAAAESAALGGWPAWASVRFQRLLQRFVPPGAPIPVPDGNIGTEDVYRAVAFRAQKKMVLEQAGAVLGGGNGRTERR